MPFEPEAGVRYDMPAAFGPSLARPVTSGYDVHSATVSFVTDPRAVESLLPRHFGVTDKPVVSVTYQRCVGMDWMGGRDYSIVSVYVTARSLSGTADLVAPYSLIIWENDCAPIVSGREYMGAPKLYAEIPDVDLSGTRVGFGCSEYGAALVEGTVDELRVVDDPAELARYEQAGREIVRTHWKYVPGLDGTPDADYPVAMYTSCRYRSIRTGSGTVRFLRPDAVAAPYSARIAARLAELPVVEPRGSVVAHAEDVQLYRDRTRRLDSDDLSGQSRYAAALGKAERWDG